MKKTWFQHDFNCSEKEKFSALIAQGGFEAYGRFWAFVELWYSMQAHKSGEYVITQRIHERTLMKHLQMNCRSLPKLMQLFSETLGIVWSKFSETYGIVYETTWDNTLNYINNRSQEKRHINKNKNKNKNESKKEKKEISPQAVFITWFLNRVSANIPDVMQAKPEPKDYILVASMLKSNGDHKLKLAALMLIDKVETQRNDFYKPTISCLKSQFSNLLSCVTPDFEKDNEEVLNAIS